MKKRIIIIFSVLIVLAGAYYALEKMGKNSGDDKMPDATPTETISIYKTEKDSISEMNISTPEFSYAFIKNGEEWKVKGAEYIKLNKSKVDSLAYAFSSINAEAVIDEPSDLSAFGFNAPLGTPYVTLSDGSVKRFTLGGKTPTGSSYYFMAEGDSRVYSVYSYTAEQFIAPLSNYRNDLLAEFDAAKLSEIQIIRKDANILMRLKSKEELSGESLGLNAWKMLSPYQRDVGGYQFEEKILKKIGSFRISKFIDDNPTTLAKYGLDKPKYTISITEQEKPKFTIHLGNGNGDDELYAMVDGEKAVYSVKEADFGFKDIEPLNLVDSLIYIQSIDKVNSISLKTGDASYVLRIERQGEEASYYINDAKAEESAFKSAYQEIIGLILRGEVKEQPSAEPIFTTEFSFNDGRQSDIIQGVPYGERYVAIKVNGVAKYYLMKEQVTSMLGKIKAFSENPTKQ